MLGRTNGTSLMGAALVGARMGHRVEIEEALKNLREALTTMVPMSGFAESRIRVAVALLERILHD